MPSIEHRPSRGVSHKVGHAARASPILFPAGKAGNFPGSRGFTFVGNGSLDRPGSGLGSDGSVVSQSFGETSMTKRISASLAVVLLFGLVVAPAWAAKGSKGSKNRSPEQRFSKLDANGDGTLSLGEMQGKGKKPAAKVEKRFKKMDRNSDGKVSLEEIKSGGKKKKSNA